MIKENIHNAESHKDSAFLKEKFKKTIELLKNKTISIDSDEFEEILKI